MNVSKSERSVQEIASALQVATNDFINLVNLRLDNMGHSGRELDDRIVSLDRDVEDIRRAHNESVTQSRAGLAGLSVRVDALSERMVASEMRERERDANPQDTSLAYLSLSDRVNTLESVDVTGALQAQSDRITRIYDRLYDRLTTIEDARAVEREALARELDERLEDERKAQGIRDRYGAVGNEVVIADILRLLEGFTGAEARTILRNVGMAYQHPHDE